ncbi:inter-alpha-trypsin inhibitor heavy chain H4-like [Saccostrea cucullata]|uniref:inter-alpha-trypsin inhibitor heavy chain H4-like n=1 Tax=Saccostrea cuccullata TaxID=36930 RepID=UPI002ED419D3
MDETVRIGILLMIGFVTFGQEVAEKNTIQKPRIYFLHVNSEIKYRFSKTVITSKVVNPGKEASETVFDVTLPNEAFMTSFKMIINGTEYKGEVKEKEQAKQEYDAARSRGQSAGHIVAKPRDSNKFQIQINVAAAEKVTFELTYRELLRRRTGKYEQLIYINPGQIVDDFRVDVSIEEYRNITSVHVPPLRNDILTDDTEGKNKDAEIVRLSPTQVKISYSLTKSQQEILSEQGISGQFVVQYDVEREKNSGEVMVMDGYFVHFLAPDGLDPMPMDIVFILDRSGSMSGTKMKQLQESMLKILNEISENDRFMLVAFDNKLKFWRRELAQATTANIAEAKQFIQNTGAEGSTDINLAMTEGLKLLSQNTQESRAPVLVFLTDGQPTSGVTNTNKILENIRKFNEVDIPIFSLAFGQGADFDFTKKVAAQNDGLGKRIYEDSDAALQIAGFYQEISAVLMRNISFKYVDGTLNESTVTQTDFNTYFKGSELVVAGKVEDMTKLQDGVDIYARGVNSEKVALRRPLICVLPPPRPFPPIIPAPSPQPQPKHPNMMENLWAYLTIKQLLRTKDGLDDKDEIKNIEKKILDMSLKYQFVTPLTSMVVTLPDDSKPNLKSVNTDDVPQSESFLTLPSRKYSIGGAIQGMYGLPGRNMMPPALLGNRSPQISFDPFGASMSRRRNFNRRNYRTSTTTTHSPLSTISQVSTPRPAMKRQALPSFIVQVSKVNMCFDLSLKKSKTYNIIKMLKQRNGCAMLANTASKQNRALKMFASLKVEKFKGKKIQETINVDAIKNFASLQCDMEGIKLDVEKDQHRLRVKAEIHGRQRKQYDGILSHFVNMKCKIVRQFSRKGKIMAKVKCRRRGRPTLKFKAIQKTSSSGDSCWFLNKRMVSSLNISPTNYEITP